MGLRAYDFGGEVIRAGSRRPFGNGKAARLTRAHVQHKDGIWPGVFQCAFFYHQGGTAFFFPGWAFFCGLEDKLHAACQLRFMFGQRLGHAQQNGDMRIMAAGMHDADFIASYSPLAVEA